LVSAGRIDRVERFQLALFRFAHAGTGDAALKLAARQPQAAGDEQYDQGSLFHDFTSASCWTRTNQSRIVVSARNKLKKIEANTFQGWRYETEVRNDGFLPDRSDDRK